MNRLQQELQRLYALQPDDGDGHGRIDAQAPVRTLVLELARPADWAALSAVWGGVQADLALPAPAIAVNGSDGCQLWFSLQEPVPTPRASGFLDALRRRYLGDIAPARITMRPTPQAASNPAAQARPVPALQSDNGMWSAFVAPDLAPMFVAEPWLDVPPNPDGQARLLTALRCITPDEFDLALQRLEPATAPAAPAPAAVQTPAAAAAAQANASDDPQRFLLEVMNDGSVALALRIEAAKALLPYGNAARGQRDRDPGADQAS